jgi:hypothetical protein
MEPVPGDETFGSRSRSFLILESAPFSSEFALGFQRVLTTSKTSSYSEETQSQSGDQRHILVNGETGVKSLLLLN